MDLQRFGVKLHICLSQLRCVDMTQHCTMPWLLRCPLVNQENKRILGFSPPQPEPPAYCLRFSRKSLTTSYALYGGSKWQATGWTPSSKNYILVWICWITPWTRSQNRLKSLCKECCSMVTVTPARGCGFLHRLQRWVCLGSCSTIPNGPLLSKGSHG